MPFNIWNRETYEAYRKGHRVWLGEEMEGNQARNYYKAIKTSCKMWEKIVEEKNTLWKKNHTCVGNKIDVFKGSSCGVIYRFCILRVDSFHFFF